MLVDLPMDWSADVAATYARVGLPVRMPRHLGQGVYETHLNFAHDIRSLIVTEYAFMDVLRAHIDRNGTLRERGEKLAPLPDLPFDFGVCDTWEQITARWPELAADEEHAYLISVTPIRKADQSPEGGWRWHKWGPYIGDHEPRCEYLYQEPAIDQVYVFHIIEVLA